MSVRTVLTRLLPGDEPEVVVECRQCGETLELEADRCSGCGSNEFERFQISG
jgi:ribosomal protein L37E